MGLPNAITGHDHEVVVLIKCKHFEIGQGRNHLFFWRQSLVSLIEVVTWRPNTNTLTTQVSKILLTGKNTNDREPQASSHSVGLPYQ